MVKKSDELENFCRLLGDFIVLAQYWSNSYFHLLTPIHQKNHIRFTIIIFV